MSKYQRPRGSVDVKLDELPKGTHRVRIIGSIVNKTAVNITINDGTGTVVLDLGKNTSKDMEITKFGRFIADISKSEKKYYGTLVAWQEISKELIKKYWKLVNIERRIPK